MPVDSLSIVPSRLSAIQAKKIRRLIEMAASQVPFYADRYKSLHLPISGFDRAFLKTIPTISKADLQGCPLTERVNQQFEMSKLSREATSGSTGRPVEICVDDAYRHKRNLRFLRALIDAGYRPWQRLMLLTDRYARSTRRYRHWHYESVEQTVEALFESYLRIRPTVLYGFTTPLRLLAEYGGGRQLPLPKLVVTTAEFLDAHTRQILESVFKCPVRDFYGMTEMGLVAWQGAGCRHYNIASKSVLTEFVPDCSENGRYRMIMTNLDLAACPIIRFDTGDFARIRHVNGHPAIIALEGRRIDAIVARNGSLISPYAVTDAIRKIPGIRQFRILQREIADFQVELEVKGDTQGLPAADVRKVLETLLGDDLHVEFKTGHNLVSEGTRKFRPVESLVGR